MYGHAYFPSEVYIYICTYIQVYICLICIHIAMYSHIYLFSKYVHIYTCYMHIPYAHIYTCQIYIHIAMYNHIYLFSKCEHIYTCYMHMPYAHLYTCQIYLLACVVTYKSFACKVCKHFCLQLFLLYNSVQLKLICCPSRLQIVENLLSKRQSHLGWDWKIIFHINLFFIWTYFFYI